MLTLKALPVFILALLVSSPALSEDIRVPEDYPTIKFAVEASVPGDTILIGPGEYQEFDLVCDSISLVGSVDGNGNPITTIDSTGLSRSVILNGTSGSVSNIRFTNFSSTAVDCQDSNTQSISIENCTFNSDDPFLDRKGFRYEPSITTCQIICEIQIQDSIFHNAWVRFGGGGCGDADQVTCAVTNCKVNNAGNGGVYGQNVLIDGLEIMGTYNYISFSHEGGSLVLKNISAPIDTYSQREIRCSSYNKSLPGEPVQISNITGSLNLDINSDTPVFLEDSILEGSPVSAVSFDGPSLSVRNSTISNNNTGIVNVTSFPFALEGSIVCGNGINIDGPYDSVGSFVLPNCGSFLGACCVNDQCESVIQEDCDALGGSWRGTNTLCSSSLCAPPVQFGICCINGSAISLFDTDCSKVGGSFFGPGDPEGFACPESCDEDINSDQTVDYEDLISVISAWGPCAG